MKVVRVLSVRPTFHKLDLEGRETQLEPHLLPSEAPPATPSLMPHPPQSRGLRAPSVLSPKPPEPTSSPRPHTGLLPSPALCPLT